jgi:hypothetical protein
MVGKMKKTGADYFLRILAQHYAGDIAEDLCQEDAGRVSRELRPGELTAYHEAGHGDMRLCFGFPVSGLHLTDHPLVKGLCTSHPWDGNLADLDDLADDELQANGILVKLHVCGYRVSVPRLKRVVRRLLKKRWPGIQAIAEALLLKENGRVDETEILEAQKVAGAIHPKAARDMAPRGPAATLEATAGGDADIQGGPGAD